MANDTSETATYTMGYSEEFLQLLHRRSLETHAAHLKPHLKAGLDVLDFGCGPGALAVRLAEAVEPGELHGVDIEASQIDIARAAARDGGHANAKFHVADVTDRLPFEDDFFDVAHCHAVLTHVPDTQAALREVKRVLKPGGILACRELVVSSCFAEPDFGDLDAAWATFSTLLAANGGHPEMGRQLKGELQQAGFADIQAGGSFESFSEPEDVIFMYNFIGDWFLSPQVIAAATTYGVATQEQFDGWRVSLDKWKDHPSAFAAFAWGETIARKPQP